MTPTRSRLVSDLMTFDPVVVRVDAPLSDAAALIETYGVTGLPVVDGKDALVGVISQTDLLRVQSTEHLWRNWPGLTVRHLMTSPPITIEAGALVLDAAALMERHRIHRLVVVADDDADRPIGVLSTSDLVRSIASEASNV